MEGYVLDYSVQSGTGIILANDGRRYEFAGSEWRDSSFPIRGTRVDFEARDGVAVAVYNNALPASVFTPDLEPEPTFQPTGLPGQVPHAALRSGRDKTTAAILAILLGGFGVHKFYLGNWGWGIVHLMFTWTTLPFFLGFIEGIRYLLLSEDEFELKVIANRTPFGIVW